MNENNAIYELHMDSFDEQSWIRIYNWANNHLNHIEIYSQSEQGISIEYNIVILHCPYGPQRWLDKF